MKILRRDLKEWKLVGFAADQRPTSSPPAGHSLLLDSPGQSAAFASGQAPGGGQRRHQLPCARRRRRARWLLEAEFRGSDGPKVLRVTLADEADAYVVEAPSPRDEGGRRRANPGLAPAGDRVRPDELAAGHGR